MFFSSFGSASDLSPLLAVLMLFAFSSTYLKLNSVLQPRLALMTALIASLMIFLMSQLFLSSHEIKH